MSAGSSFDSKGFRNALGTFTTGVTIITARAHDGTAVGITANSFNSVSLDPPMVLWSLAKTSRSLSAFNETAHWAVHILSAEQEGLSNHFARSCDNKFSNIDTENGVGDTPLLTGCTARLQCKTLFKYEGGDHFIFVGEVVDFDRSDAPPLVFHGGKYALATRKIDSVSLTRAPVRDLDTSFGDDFLGYLLGRAHAQIYNQLREHLRRYELNDTQYFILSLLSVQSSCSMEKINALISYTGYEATILVMDELCERGLVHLVGTAPTACYSLTVRGRDTSIHIIAAAKSIESSVLAKFGYMDSLALKSLLKQLIMQTDPGLPDLWESTHSGCE